MNKKYINTMLLKIIVIIFLVGFSISVDAVDSVSSSYIIERSSTNSGGGLSTSSNYGLEDNAGIINSGDISGTSYNIDVGYQQEDDVEEDTCNSNDICEEDLGETVVTCPSDCHLSGGIPTLIGMTGEGSHIGGGPSGLFRVDQGFFDIKNINVSSTKKKEIEVSWQINRSASIEFILSDEKGKEKFRYIEPAYKNLHKILIPGLDLTKKYYFRILLTDLVGVSNYEYSDLYIIEPLNLVIEDKDEEAVGGGVETGKTQTTINYNVEVKNQDIEIGNIEIPESPNKQKGKISYWSRFLSQIKETLFSLLEKTLNFLN